MGVVRIAIETHWMGRRDHSRKEHRGVTSEVQTSTDEVHMGTDEVHMGTNGV